MAGLDRSKSIFNGMPKPQKYAVWFLAVIALLIVIFWIWQVKSQLSSPFDYKTSPQEQANALGSNNTASSTASMNLLKETDTDGDGLSDYAELYIYHTSPYLADSDSDGIPDLKEIEQGTDPNCPTGQTCNGNASTVSTSTAGTVPTFSTPPDLSNISATSSNISASSPATSTLDKAALEKVLNGQASAATLRQVLISSGAATAAQLQNISDKELLQSYQQTLSSGQYNSTSSASTTSTVNAQ